MTEKERIEKTYSIIRKKNPDITDTEQLESLAIKADKRRTILTAFAWLAGGIAAFIVWRILVNSGKESLTLIFMMMAGSGLFEFYRTLGKYSGIEKRYRPVADSKYAGSVTAELITKRGGSTLKKSGGRYILEKVLLTDKKDDLDTGTDNETHHTYFLYFDRDGFRELQVKRNVYLDAVLNVPYIAVLSVDENGEITGLVDAYPLPNWELAEELRDAYRGEDFDQINADAQALKAANTKTKNRNTLPIIAIVLSALGLVLSVLLAIPMNLAALTLSAIAFAKQRGKLTTASVVVSIIGSVITVLALIAVLA